MALTTLDPITALIIVASTQANIDLVERTNTHELA